MSEVVEQFPPRGGFERAYPWESWADGRIHVCTKGSDFEVRPMKFAQAAWSFAKRTKRLVRTAVRGDQVYLQFRSLAEEAPKKPGTRQLRSVG